MLIILNDVRVSDDWERRNEMKYESTRLPCEYCCAWQERVVREVMQFGTLRR